MSDSAHKEVDDLIDELTKQIQSVYSLTGYELQKKLSKYLRSFDRLRAEKYQAMIDGRLSPQEYQNWIIGKVAIGQRWQQMCDWAANELTIANQTALDYVNGVIPSVYVSNYNHVAAGIENVVTGYSFTLVDAATVKFLMRNNELLLPQAKVNIPKDHSWNVKQINAQLLQGILQGESNDDIANRMMTVSNMCAGAAIRNARTMTTAAENKGRIDSMTAASEAGIDTQKQWLATSDGRTRDTHLDVSGTLIAHNEMFHVGNSELMYPGDSAGEPCEVYNCRCTLLTKVVGFRNTSSKQPVRVAVFSTGNRSGVNYQRNTSTRNTSSVSTNTAHKSNQYEDYNWLGEYIPDVQLNLGKKKKRKK